MYVDFYKRRIFRRIHSPQCRRNAMTSQDSGVTSGRRQSLANCIGLEHEIAFLMTSVLLLSKPISHSLREKKKTIVQAQK